MRRSILSALILAFCGCACVSDSTAILDPRPYPIFQLEPPRPRQVSIPRPLVSVTPTRTTQPWNSPWHPIGGRISSRWTYIVVHHSATRRGGAKAFDQYHREANGWDELGYHFVIGNGSDTPDGHVEVGTRWLKQKHGAHCKTPNNYYNEHGIGICLVGDFTRSRPTQKQTAALERLVRFLSHECAIGPNRVTTHAAVKGTTVCPGPYFRLASLRRALQRAPTASSMP